MQNSDKSFFDKKQLEDKLKKLKKLKSKYMEMYSTDVITMAELKELTEELSGEIEKYTLKIENTNNNSYINNRRNEIIKKYCENIETLFSDENMDNPMLRQVIEKISVSEKGDINVYLKIYNNLNIKKPSK